MVMLAGMSDLFSIGLRAQNLSMSGKLPGAIVAMCTSMRIIYQAQRSLMPRTPTIRSAFTV